MKINALLKKVLLTMSCLYCLHTTTTFAFFEPPTPSTSTIQAFVTNLDYIAKVISDIYSKALIATADLVYEFDNALPVTIAQNATIDKTQKAVDESIANNLDTAISINLTDNVVKQNNAIDFVNNTHAEDDIPLPFKIPSSSIFAPSTDTYESDTGAFDAYKKGNAMLNINTLLAPDKYTPEQDEYAKNYLRYIESLAPSPPIIRVSKVFSIPSSDPNNAMNPNATDKIILNGKDTFADGKTPNTVKNLQDHLSTSAKYQSYKLSYRSMIAAKSLFLSNLYRSYQSRVDRKGISAAKLEHDEVYKRLNPDYYKEMSQASPAVVERETLFLLAQINRNIYEMRRNDERRMVMDSISGLQSSAISNVLLSQIVKDISKEIYCFVTYPKPDSCNSATSGAPALPISSDITGIKP